MRERGVRAEDRVAVHLRRTLDSVVAMIALAKLDATYVPLDPAYPDERLEYLLADSRLVLVPGPTPTAASAPATPATNTRWANGCAAATSATPTATRYMSPRTNIGTPWEPD
ncbi:AMP-binding protein [Saccharopolyspora spinosa]